MPRLLADNTSNNHDAINQAHDFTNPIRSLNPENENPKVPTENDILCGRGKHNYHHHGNIHFLSLIKQFDYRESCPSFSKPSFAKQIYSRLCQRDPPARFLKAHPQGDEIQWFEMGKKEAMLKIRQAMRDYEARLQKKQVKSGSAPQFPRRVVHDQEMPNCGVRRRVESGSIRILEPSVRLVGDILNTRSQQSDFDLCELLVPHEQNRLRSLRNQLLPIPLRRNLMGYEMYRKSTKPPFLSAPSHFQFFRNIPVSLPQAYKNYGYLSHLMSDKALTSRNGPQGSHNRFAA